MKGPLSFLRRFRKDKDAGGARSSDVVPEGAVAIVTPPPPPLGARSSGGDGSAPREAADDGRGGADPADPRTAKGAPDADPAETGPERAKSTDADQAHAPAGPPPAPASQDSAASSAAPSSIADASRDSPRGRNSPLGSGGSTCSDSSRSSAGGDRPDGHRHARGPSSRRLRGGLPCPASLVGLDEILSGAVGNPSLVRVEVPLGKPIGEVYGGVHDGPVLGSGVSGTVRLAHHRGTGAGYAVKCLDVALIDSEEGLRRLKEEIYIMCQLDHPNIVRLEEVYESHSQIYLVQEVCNGGELFDRLDEQPDYHYTEAQCARLVRQMLGSVRYIHNKGIIHRDLKLENFLFSDDGAGAELKMIDFGLSKHFTFGEVHHEAVGTPYTVAPEVIRGNYDERCDVWAIGVITYLLLSGESPFGGCGGPETLMQVRDNILRGDFEFEPFDIWLTVSKEAKDFIRSLLVVDPTNRPTARQAKESKWLKMWSSRESDDRNGEDSTINPNVVKALVGFKEYSDMRKLLCEVLSFTLLPEQIRGLRKEFEKYDPEGTGEITLSTLKKVLIGNASTGSLGGMTEEEVVGIFNAMRVRKGETSIHWHDFIAAGLSQCQVDDRNLRLAFERLDQERKGYITFHNFIDLMGDSTFEDEDQMLKIWGESMKDVNLQFINYDDFVLLMKGQGRDREGNRFRKLSIDGLAVVPEITCEDDDHSSSNQQEFPVLQLDEMKEITAATNPELNPEEASPDLVASMSPGRSSFIRMGSSSAPATPLHFRKEIEEADSPLSMDDGGESSPLSNEQYPSAFQTNNLGDLTPPQTPVRGPADYVTPLTVARVTARMDPQMVSHLSPPDLSMTGANALNLFLGRGRSVSLDERDTYSSLTDVESRRTTMLKRDSRFAVAIPEDTPSVSDTDGMIEDKQKTPLVVNRALYRAHREFRHAVTEACKRFEGEQMRRAKETLQAQESAVAEHTAGLVMRHGQALSEQSIKNFLRESLAEQQKLVDQANRRGGRGRRSRKKTISDMSGMMGAPLPETMAVASERTLTSGEAPPKEEVNENLLRNPTKPGEFRKTNYNPFQRKSIVVFENGSLISGAASAEMSSTPPPPLLL